LVAAAVGVVIILAGIVSQVIQLVVSIRNREQLKVTADPWNGRTLEWATASPPPAWNFTVLPQVTDLDALWNKKQRERTQQAQPPKERKFEPIELPKNSPIGVIIAFFAVVTGFALIWHIWWMAGAGAIGIFLTVLAFAFRNEEEIEITAGQIARFERANQAEIAV
jgi:cytochrome o ubiquinol oxidase subunit 1